MGECGPNGLIGKEHVTSKQTTSGDVINEDREGSGEFSSFCLRMSTGLHATTVVEIRFHALHRATH